MGYIRKNKIFVWSRISKFLRPAQRYDKFKLIRITCQVACHGKTEHGKTSKTVVVLIAGVTISSTPYCTIWCRSIFGPCPGTSQTAKNPKIAKKNSGTNELNKLLFK